MTYSSSSGESETPEINTPRPTTLIAGAFEKDDLQNRVANITERLALLSQGLEILNQTVLLLEKDLAYLNALPHGEEE